MRNQTIGPQAAIKLAEFARKYPPYEVSELRIEHCQIKSTDLQAILVALNDTQMLEYLSLVNLQMDQQNCKVLQEFISLSKYLLMIDLSYNKIAHQEVLPLLRCICENTKLKKINLAWNPLVPKSNYG